ncbi:MAG TPA: hypothetical protein VF622_07650 [Segetibacter sp.]|jgi:hypothetical protein
MKTGISLLLLAIVMLIHCFGAKSQTTPKAKPPAWAGISLGSTKEGISKELMAEYKSIVSKYVTKGIEWWKIFEKNISMEDKSRLEQIFKQMSTEQQSQQQVAFVKSPEPLKKVVPSDKEFNSWKTPNHYGVWIDGKKVNNTVLEKYQRTDFNQVAVSKLYGVAKKNKKYSYQVNLMTMNYYREYYELSIAKGGIRMVFRA